MAPEDAPATKRDLREMEERLSERMRDMQTELPKGLFAFPGAGRPEGFRLGGPADRLGWRVNTVVRRLSEIEKKLLLDPPAE